MQSDDLGPRPAVMLRSRRSFCFIAIFLMSGLYMITDIGIIRNTATYYVSSSIVAMPVVNNKTPVSQTSRNAAEAITFERLNEGAKLPSLVEDDETLAETSAPPRQPSASSKEKDRNSSGVQTVKPRQYQKQKTVANSGRMTLSPGKDSATNLHGVGRKTTTRKGPQTAAIKAVEVSNPKDAGAKGDERASRSPQEKDEDNEEGTGGEDAEDNSAKDETGETHDDEEDEYDSPDDELEDAGFVGFDNRTISLVVRLKGEFGNQLSSLAHGFRIKQTAKRYGIKVKMIAQHQIKKTGERKKWVRGRDEIKGCFPKLRDMDFSGGKSNPEFRRITKLQAKWLEARQTRLLHNPYGKQPMSMLKALMKEQRNYTGNSLPPESPGSNYSVPMITSMGFSFFDYLFNTKMYNKIRYFFAFDYKACCTQVPYPDEIVLHYRNFLGEFNGNEKLIKAFPELSPENTYKHLFPNHTRGQRVAIVSRFTENMQPYVDTLEAHGLRVRLITGHKSAMEDFCFLLKAQQEIVGTSRSTFTRWAALLGDAKKVILYKAFYRDKQKKTLMKSRMQEGRNIITMSIYQTERYELAAIEDRKAKIRTPAIQVSSTTAEADK